MEVDQFPDDVIAEIFVRLPVKSLLRFKCLSKSFHALIRSFGFVNTHLTRSSQAFNRRKIIFEDDSKNKFHACDVNFSSKDEIPPLGKPVSSPFKQVYGYCKGLILLNRTHRYEEPSHSLWNPSTRRYKDVPAFITSFPFSAHFQIVVGSGMGYDESRDEFKAVYIVEIEEQGKPECQFWVYGLRSGFGRALKFPFSLRDVIGRRPCCPFSNPVGLFADGCVHWLCRLFPDGHLKIVAFDVGKETFWTWSVPQPPFSLELMSRFQKQLHVLGGRLCITYFVTDPLPHAELYVRNKNGSGGFGWSLIYSVREPLCFDTFWFDYVKVLGYMGGGDKILLDLNEGYTVSYDLKSKSFERVGIEKEKKWRYLILCEESLASVDGLL